MSSCLHESAKNLYSGDPTTKPLSYYKKYDDFLNKNSLNPKTILEIGTYLGESAKVLSTSFPDALIISLDNVDRQVDFSKHKNIRFYVADQTNRVDLEKIISKNFKNGVDLVIDDASHYGYYSKITFEIVFPFINSGGAYFIEDWGTGYWDDWHDGSRFQEFPTKIHDANIPKRIPSHDFGMVGFVKSLVDLTHQGAVKPSFKAESNKSSQIQSLEFSEGVCLALKT